MARRVLRRFARGAFGAAVGCLASAALAYLVLEVLTPDWDEAGIDSASLMQIALAGLFGVLPGALCALDSRREAEVQRRDTRAWSAAGLSAGAVLAYALGDADPSLSFGPATALALLVGGAVGALVAHSHNRRLRSTDA